MTLYAVCHTCKKQHRIDNEPQGVVRYMDDWCQKHLGHNVGIHVPTSNMLPYGHNADVKRAYAASSAITVTNLQALASSATWVAGWESGAIDNTTNLYDDYRVTAKLVAESAGLSAGQIRLYLVGPLDDSSWPDVFDGTESTETVTDTEIRDAICKLGAVTVTDTTASRTYYLDCPSVADVFGGNLPKKFVIFITQSTGAALETTGSPNAVYVTGSYHTVA